MLKETYLKELIMTLRGTYSEQLNYLINHLDCQGISELFRGTYHFHYFYNNLEIVNYFHCIFWISLLCGHDLSFHPQEFWWMLEEAHCKLSCKVPLYSRNNWKKSLLWIPPLRLHLAGYRWRPKAKAACVQLSPLELQKYANLDTYVATSLFGLLLHSRTCRKEVMGLTFF